LAGKGAEKFNGPGNGVGYKKFKWGRGGVNLASLG